MQLPWQVNELILKIQEHRKAHIPAVKFPFKVLDQFLQGAYIHLVFYEVVKNVGL